ncbi:MAG: hypothetical protein JWQ27_660 [Ferruginibacter sp.]|nr:hypothetical protein [Ferruginibacter sp.]
MKHSLLPLSLIIIVITSCSSLKPESFATSQPVLDPVKFFGGRTESAGVMESRGGKPTVRITTKTTGTYANGMLHIEQDLYPENKKQNHRSFNLKITDAHHVEGTGSDIQGTARGELYGNYFTWSFRLRIAEKGLVQHVKMTQYMYLMPDGQTLIIRSVVRKFGMIVTQITEQFHKVG